MVLSVPIRMQGLMFMAALLKIVSPDMAVQSVVLQEPDMISLWQVRSGCMAVLSEIAVQIRVVRSVRTEEKLVKAVFMAVR